MAHEVMTQRLELLIGRVVAALAGVIRLPADLKAGGSLRVVMHLVVTQRLELLIGGVVAALAGVIGLPADVKAGGSLRFVAHLVMAERITIGRFAYAAYSLFGAGRRSTGAGIRLGVTAVVLADAGMRAIAI